MQLDPTDSPAAIERADLRVSTTLAAGRDVRAVPLVDGGGGQVAVVVPGRAEALSFEPGLGADGYIERRSGSRVLAAGGR